MGRRGSAVIQPFLAESAPTAFGQDLPVSGPDRHSLQSRDWKNPKQGRRAPNLAVRPSRIFRRAPARCGRCCCRVVSTTRNATGRDGWPSMGTPPLAPTIRQARSGLATQAEVRRSCCGITGWAELECERLVIGEQQARRGLWASKPADSGGGPVLLPVSSLGQQVQETVVRAFGVMQLHNTPAGLVDAER